MFPFAAWARRRPQPLPTRGSMEFEELYGAAEPEEAVIKADAAHPAGQAPAAAAPEDGDDLFLQLYGETAPEIKTEEPSRSGAPSIAAISPIGWVPGAGTCRLSRCTSLPPGVYITVLQRP